VEDAAWDAQIVQPENGFVALDDSYVEAMGLPHSMRSPWYKDKGIYILTSSHEIHCVVSIRYLSHPIASRQSSSFFPRSTSYAKPSTKHTTASLSAGRTAT
jgi:hypothetical protein